MNRQSRRLRQSTPEITEDTFRCICLLTVFTCQSNVVHVPCCGQFLYHHCLQQRRASHQTCPYCRGNLPTDWQPEPSSERTLNAGNRAVVERLLNLFNSEELREILQQVSVNFYFKHIHKTLGHFFLLFTVNVTQLGEVIDVLCFFIQRFHDDPLISQSTLQKKMAAVHFITKLCGPNTARRHITSHIVYAKFKVFRTFLCIFL